MNNPAATAFEYQVTLFQCKDIYLLYRSLSICIGGFATFPQGGIRREEAKFSYNLQRKESEVKKIILLLFLLPGVAVPAEGQTKKSEFNLAFPKGDLRVRTEMIEGAKSCRFEMTDEPELIVFMSDLPHSRLNINFFGGEDRRIIERRGRKYKVFEIRLNLRAGKATVQYLENADPQSPVANLFEQVREACRILPYPAAMINTLSVKPRKEAIDLLRNIAGSMNSIRGKDYSEEKRKAAP